MWSFSEWLLLSSIMSSRQNYMALCACTSIFSIPTNAPLHGDKKFFYQWVDNGVGFAFWLWGMMNASMNIHVQISVLCHFAFPPMVKIPNFLHPHQYFSLFIFLTVSSLADVNEYLTVDLIHFPLPGDNDALHHFEHLVTIFTREMSVLIFWLLLKSGLLFKVQCSLCKLCYSRNFWVKLKFFGNKLFYPILFSSAGYQTPGSMPYCSATSWATFSVAVGSVVITLFSVFNTGNYVYF